MAGDGLSLLELCDVAYVLWLEQVRQEYLADRQAFGVWASTSSPESTFPVWETRKAEHDAWLASEGRPANAASALEQLLGLAA